MTEQLISNISSEIIPRLPEEVIGKMAGLLTIFQAIGGLIIAYLVFNIISVIWSYKYVGEMRRMRMLLEEINKKLAKQKK